MHQQISQPVEFSLPIKNYNEFYRFYLTEHRNINSRRLHAVGSSLWYLFWSKAIRQRKAKIFGVWSSIWLYLCMGWVFFFEHNKPASFKQPLYSFISDWRMLSDIVCGRLSLIDRKFDKIES